jgi:hypothetical protein
MMMHMIVDVDDDDDDDDDDYADDDGDDGDDDNDDDSTQIKIVYCLSPWLLEEIRYTEEHRR